MKNALLTILILIVAIGLAAILILTRPEPEEKAAERPITSIEVITVQPETIQLILQSQGTVLPQTESDLAIEVSGRIIEVADNFRPGASIRKGDVLLKIDPADYKAALAARTADLAQAQLVLAQEKALAEQAEADWKSLGSGKPSDLTLHKPQLAQAKALVASAQAMLERAQRDLAHTQVTAPYDGRVLTKSVDLGQYVMANPTGSAARIYATDTAEVRLPLTNHEAQFLDDPEQHPAPVHLSADTREWSGTLTRIEGTIDTSSRLLYAVAEIQSPFNGPNALRRGRFVHAEIEGRTLPDAYSIPRYALRGSNTVYVLTDNSSLQERTVHIVKSDAKHVIIDEGLQAGDQVATSPIAYYIENMPVQVIGEDANSNRTPSRSPIAPTEPVAASNERAPRTTEK